MSNKEQLSFCLRSMEENLNAFKDFRGFYLLENIKGGTIVHVIKDILIRISLRLSNCRGQTYDWAPNMMGKESWVLTQVLAEQPNTFAINCQRHSFCPSVKSVAKECDILLDVNILHDVMGVVINTCILVKFSQKQEHLQGNINDNIEKKESEMFKKSKKASGNEMYNACKMYEKSNW